jgi:hypothetical protein
VFVIGFDNHVWSSFWNDAAGWSSEWFALHGGAVFDHQKQQVAAVSRTPNNLDLFVIGFDNHVWTTFWGPRAPMTLDVQVGQSSPTVPVQVGLHIGATDGIVTETNWHWTKNGVLLPDTSERIPAGVAVDRILGINDPGSYGLTVNRIGLTRPDGPTTLTRNFTINAQAPSEPVRPPVPPTIEVEFSGSIANARFHVAGSKFLPDRPHHSNQGVTIRFVDANYPPSDRREFTGSSNIGEIDAVIELNLIGIKLDALGNATVAISATDGRPNPNDSTGFLWSNTVRIPFRG